MADRLTHLPGCMTTGLGVKVAGPGPHREVQPVAGAKVARASTPPGPPAPYHPAWPGSPFLGREPGRRGGSE